MARTVLSLSALILSIIFLVAGNTFLSTLLGIRLSLENTDPAIIGWVLVGFSAGSIVGTLYCRRVIERVGHIRSFAVFAAIMAIVALLHPLIIDPWVWAGLRAISGFSMAGLIVIIESWVSSRASNENRGKLFAIYQIAVFSAAASGQLLIATASPGTLTPFSIAAILLTLALIPLAMTRIEAPAIDQVTRLSFRELLRISPLALIAAPATGMVGSAFSAMGPVYAHSIGLEVREIAIFMAVPVMAAMFFAWPIGRLSDMFRRRSVLLFLAVAATLCSAVAAIWGRTNLLLLFVMAECVVGFSAAIYPISVALLNDKLHHHQIVAASAGLLLSHGLGSCLGPVLGASAVSYLGPDGLFIFIAVVMFLLTLYTIWRISRSVQMPASDQESFVTSMPVSVVPIINELDPRNDDFRPAHSDSDSPLFTEAEIREDLPHASTQEKDHQHPT